MDLMMPVSIERYTVRFELIDRLGCNTNRPQNAPGGGAANFLTGAALGALGGYVFGNRNQR